jgi:two-component system OmpR family sensor kinase
MLRSEKKSLFRFLVIYLITTMTLFTLANIWFYTYEKHQILDTQRESLKDDSESIIAALRELHRSDEEKLQYPTSLKYQSAIFDIDKNFIFGDFNPKNINFNSRYKITDKTFYHVQQIMPHYLGAAFLVVKKPINQTPIKYLLKMTLFFMIIALLIFIILGYFLGRLFTAPMRESFKRLNSFIEDTTHELNTPISTILTNIELLDTLYECEGKKERKRIEIASKTLSRLYDDLTYLKLSHKYHRDIKPINISKLIEERLLYFSSMIENKKIYLKKDIKPNIKILIDENDAIRLIDNILSNAIKYNKPQGELFVKLTSNTLLIKDSGIGMNPCEVEKIFKRFERSNKSEGGFGIGMDIVNQVIKYYDFKIEINSKINIGTEVKILW